MMASAPQLTRNDRRWRHRAIVEAAPRFSGSRALATHFGLSDSHVRSVLRLYGVNRRPGRPTAA